MEDYYNRTAAQGVTGGIVWWKSATSTPTPTSVQFTLTFPSLQQAKNKTHTQNCPLKLMTKSCYTMATVAATTSKQDPSAAQASKYHLTLSTALNVIRCAINWRRQKENEPKEENNDRLGEKKIRTLYFFYRGRGRRRENICLLRTPHSACIIMSANSFMNRWIISLWWNSWTICMLRVDLCE